MTLAFGVPNSISARLTLLNVLVSGIALLLALASFLAYDVMAFRRDLAHTLHTEAQIVGANTVSALLFEDQQAASNTLAALRGSPEVVSAVVLKPDGKPFARYMRDGGTPILNVSPIRGNGADTESTRGNDLLYGSSINFGGKQIGSIYILADTGGQVQRSMLYAMIAALVLLVCLATALLLTSAFRHLLTDPLIGLAQTAQIVRREKDYAVRAKLSGRDDELALLVRSFNEMLDEIQHRDLALERSRAELEEKVQQRTSELSAANKELEAFSYTVAHDLRGPLDSIGNLAFLLQQSYAGALDGEGQEFLEQLLGSTGRMSGLIQDLLNLSRAARSEFHREVTDLSKMVNSILYHRTVQEPERKVEFTVAAGAMVLADEGLLCVAMENLLGNAWKYTAKRSLARIEFGSMQPDGETIFFVRDNGAGFDPAFADRLFQPFQRLHGTDEYPGTGIGLATVYRIITRHGGRIWADGAVNRGATFYFTLPYIP